MADRKFTLLELHFDRGFQIGPKTIGVGGDDEAEDLEAEAEDEEFDDEESGSGLAGAGKALLALVLLAGIAVVVRKLLGGDDEAEFEEEQAEIEEFEPA